MLEEQDRIGIPNAAANNPLASRGSNRATTFSPGTAIAQFSTDCECCAPKRNPAPLAADDERQRELAVGDVAVLAISLAVRSQQTAKKSQNMISAMGRRPVIAAPIAAPRIACSQIGVSRTRVRPNVRASPGWP